MPASPILTLPLRREEDVAGARLQARRLGECLGLDPRGQTRLATAVSEIARNALLHGGGGEALFLLQAQPPLLLVRISDAGPGMADPAAMLEGRDVASGQGPGGLLAARRLVDRLRLDSAPGQGTRVELEIPLSARTPPPTPEAIARTLQQHSQPNPMQALHEQNRELLRSLEELRQRQDERDRLNAELEDTNRGVVALHAELEQRAEDLRRAGELKSRFLSHMSHEFRTPLNSILALSRLLLDRADGPLQPEQEKQVQLLRRSAETLLDMVDDLLDTAKVEAGKLQLRATSFSAAELMGGLRAALKPLQSSGAVELVFEDAAGIPPLQSDEGKVAQILRNLVSNALKFTEVGEVRVAARYDEAADLVTFSVADTGLGIAPEDVDRIFEEFSQVESAQGIGGRLTASGRSKGTGLGLPLSRRLAELLGGRILVESTPGRGSVFRLVLPRRLPSPPAGGPVLVIDDDESFRYVFRQLIGDLGHAVVEAADGPRGLALARSLRPSAIVLDLRMPDMDGFAVFRALATDPATAAIPVLIATSSVIDAPTRAALAGAAGLLPKAMLTREVMGRLLHGMLAGDA